MSEDVDHRRRGSRYRARKRAVSLLFEAELRDADVVGLAEERRQMGEDSQEFHDVAPYTMEIVTGVAERLDRLDSTITEHLREWTLERLPAVDRAVLRAGAWELLFGSDEVDSAVVIDQAVLLVSDLSAEKSVPYVNAVLDRVAGLAQHIRAAERAVSGLDTPPADAASDAAGGGSGDVSEATSADPGTDPEG
ncbi:NusB antitermination factor [Dietzia kunjamensis subsp. schimae]|uniref:Transcription antitermination protein NusB n=1 Tax=Dietzia kunjamensis subsp. schimae TaxID=498198 RepID=A0ABY1MWM3_9ACTN|nr:transcription antitermination factor NusB [Dietzia kunjamensis]MBB1014513.1 transcription antitermination factor NusB [Dietzia kunjamensis subsp. schimae]SMO33624.1 NusB antitermination factor [Dietzia kunjamensis subsp. schimae]